MFSKQLFLHKECIGGLKTNLRSHAKTCLLITCSCKNHEKINKHAHLDDIQRYGWGTLAHLSWTSIGLMCFPSGFWGYLAEILKTLRKYNHFFNLIYTLLICFDIQTTNKKKRKTSRKPKKHKPRENQKTQKQKTKTKKQRPDRNPDFSQNLLFFLRFFRFCRCSKAEKIPKDATETFG